jgi:hypothetical protein
MHEETLFHRALELPAAERASFLDAECGNDLVLRERVEALLRAHQNPGSFLGQPVLQPTPAVGPADTPHTGPRPLLSNVPGGWIGPYELVEPIGEGGMGVVWKARHRDLKRTVALKMIRAGAAAGLPDRARFRVEAESVARLQHPNIVQLFEVGDHDGLPFVALELVEGGSLAHRLQGQPLPPVQAARLIEMLAQAMHLAHSRNIVHRDLKPANVLLTAEGLPKVTDFGLARQLDTDSGQTESGLIMGTPGYMAPEQASGQAHAVGPAADVWALGAILYECLTGRPPFKGATALETLEQVRNREPVSPRSLNLRVPRDLETICLKCLHKDPARRYSSARELADDLERFRLGEPILARRVGTLVRLAKWVRRHPAVAFLLMALVIVFATGTIVSTSLFLRAEHQKTKAEQAQDRAEHTTARSWLRTVGRRDLPTADELEVLREALTEVAAYPESRLRRLFLEIALEKPGTAAQLNRRCAPAVHAAVGLDRGQREEVRRHLLVRLRDPEADAVIREACVQTGTALELRDPEYARTALGVALEEMTRTTNLAALTVHGQAIAVLVESLDEDEASPAVTTATRRLLDVIDQTTDQKTRTTLRLLLPALMERVPAVEDAVIELVVKATSQASVVEATPIWKALAGRLSPAQATLAADRLFKRIAATQDEYVRSPFGAGLAPLVSRLPSDRVAAIFERTLDELLRGSPLTQPGLGQPGLAQALTALVERLAPDEARPACQSAAQRIVDRLEKPAQRRPPLSPLVRALPALLKHMEREEAGSLAQRAATAFLEVSRRIDAPDDLAGMAEGFPGLLEWLTPEAADRDCVAVALRVLLVMGRRTNASSLAPLVAALQPLMERLSPTGLAAIKGSLLREILTTRMPEARPEQEKLAALWQTLVRRLGMQAGNAAVQPLLAFLGGSPSQISPTEMLRLFPGLPEQLSQAEAATLLPKVLATQARLTTAGDRARFAPILAVVAGRADPDAAHRHCGPVAQQIFADMTGQPGMQAQVIYASCAEGLAALAPWLSEDERDRTVHAGARWLLERTAKTTEQVRVQGLVRALAALGPRLSPDEAAAAVQWVQHVMSESSLPQYVVEYTPLLPPLLGRLPPDQARAEAGAALKRVLHLVREETLGTGRSLCNLTLPALLPLVEAPVEDVLLHDLASRLMTARMLTDHKVLTDALRTLASQASVPQLVEVLKEPVCVGQPRAVLLDELGQRLGHPFRDIWELVDWLHDHRPDINVAAPLRHGES